MEGEGSGRSSYLIRAKTCISGQQRGKFQRTPETKGEGKIELEKKKAGKT